MLVGNLTKFTPVRSGKGGKKFKNLGKIHFEEYLGLLCSLIRLTPEQFSADESSVFYSIETSKFHTKAILQFCIDNIKACQSLLSKDKSKNLSAAKLISVYFQLCQALLEIAPTLQSTAAVLLPILTDLLLTERSPSRDKQTRRRAYTLLLTLCKDGNNYSQTLQILY